MPNVFFLLENLMEPSLFSSAAAAAAALSASAHQTHHLLPPSSTPSGMGIPSPYSILAAAAASHTQSIVQHGPGGLQLPFPPPTHPFPFFAPPAPPPPQSEAERSHRHTNELQRHALIR